MSKKSFLWIVTLLCPLLFFAGCGSINRDTYRIGIDPSWYPLEIPGKKTQLTAFFNDLLKEIAQEENVEFTQVMTNWNTLLTGLLGTKQQVPQYEAIISSMQPYTFNEKQYDFSDLILATGPVIVLPADAQIDSLDQLAGKEVAVLRGSKDALILEKYPGIIIRIYDSIPQALNDILTQTIDGAMVNVLTAEAYCKDLYQGQLTIGTPPLSQEGLRLVSIHEKADPLMKLFGRGLDTLKKNGRYDALKKQWGF